MEIIWKDIRGFSAYQVNNFGEIRDQYRNRIIEPSYSRGAEPELKVMIRHDNGRFKSVLVKRIVAEAFIDRRQSDYDIEYIDGNPDNVRPYNLRLVDWGMTDRARNANDIPPGTRILCIDTGQEFGSIYECCKKLGVKPSAVKRCLRNPMFICKPHCHLKLIYK